MENPYIHYIYIIQAHIYYYIFNAFRIMFNLFVCMFFVICISSIKRYLYVIIICYELALGLKIIKFYVNSSMAHL